MAKNFEPKNKEKQHVVQYKVSGVVPRSERQINVALRELRELQNRNFFSYQEWARREVKYDDLNAEDESMKANLKKHNDAYAISIISSCMGPMREGFNFSSILASLSTFYMLKSVNPDTEQDMHRLLASLHEQVAVMASESRGGISNFFLRKLDKEMGKAAAVNLNKDVAVNLNNGSIDQMVMTPRQLAALKLNFYEQYYFDIRNLKGSNKNIKKQEITVSYNKALTHLEQIAKNSGFDMKVVAMEERYFAGLKMKADPRYKALFLGTSDMFGAVPDMSDDRVWDGTFKTADDHVLDVEQRNHSFDGKPNYGFDAFVVREPDDFSTPEAKEAFFLDNNKHLKLLTDQLAAFAYVSSKDCLFSSEIKSRLKKQLDGKVEDYAAVLETRLYHDGFGSEAECKKAVKENLTDVYEKLTTRFSSPKFDAKNAPRSLNSGNKVMDAAYDMLFGELNEYGLFRDEVNFVVLRDCIEKTGGDRSSITRRQVAEYYEKGGYSFNDNYRIGASDTGVEYFERIITSEDPSLVYNKEHLPADAPANQLKPGKRTPFEIINDMKDNYLEALGSGNPKNALNFMEHVAFNVAQGKRKLTAEELERSAARMARLEEEQKRNETKVDDMMAEIDKSESLPEHNAFQVDDLLAEVDDLEDGPDSFT